jgi:hypothetical protein
VLFFQMSHKLNTMYAHELHTSREDPEWNLKICKEENRKPARTEISLQINAEITVYNFVSRY